MESNVITEEEQRKRKIIYDACESLMTIVPDDSSAYRVLLSVSIYTLGAGPKHSTLSGLMERWELFASSSNTDEDKEIYKAFIAILQAAGL